MAQSSTCVKSGNVTLGKGKSKRKKHYIKLFKSSENGLARLEIYEDEKSSTIGVPIDLIVAGDVVRIVHDAGKEKKEYIFAVLTKEKNTYVIAVTSPDIRDEWTKHINSILFQAVQNNRVSAQNLSRKNTITDNDIYDSAEEYLRDFDVKVSDETSRRLSLNTCMVKLMVESGNITVIKDASLIGRWAIEHLRRFGYSDNDFHFEAGRKSELGAGLFSFKTKKGKSIHMTVTREKHELRGNRVCTPGETEPPRIGAVQQDLMQFDGHCYEEINVVQKTIHKQNPGGIPSKPSRGAANPPPPPQSPMTKAPPPGSFHNNASGGSQVYTEITQTKNAWKHHGRDVEDDDKEDDPIYEEGGGYDSLNRNTLTNPQTDNYVDNSMYRSDSPTEVPVLERQTSEIAGANDCIYAEIDKSQKTKNRETK